jgi:hypothetical protein
VTNIALHEAQATRHRRHSRPTFPHPITRPNSRSGSGSPSGAPALELHGIVTARRPQQRLHESSLTSPAMDAEEVRRVEPIL